MGLTFPGTGVQMDKLWTNPSTGSSFAKQSFTVKELSAYKYICISFKRAAGANQEQFVLSERGHGSECIGQIGYTTFMVREFSSYNDIVSFEDCHSGTSINNDLLVPYQIFGVN